MLQCIQSTEHSVRHMVTTPRMSMTVFTIKETLVFVLVQPLVSMFLGRYNRGFEQDDL